MLIARVMVTLVALGLAAPLQAQSVKFGDDSGDYPRDDECDDRRFYGPAMPSTLNWLSVGKDATDCRSAVAAGRAALWRLEDARAATRCEAIKWGDDSSDYARDGICDDPRFEGRGAAGILLSEDAGRDATDCRNLCEYGLIFLRNY